VRSGANDARYSGGCPRGSGHRLLFNRTTISCGRAQACGSIGCWLDAYHNERGPPFFLNAFLRENEVCKPVVHGLS
jgi:hypothetical protein